MTARDPMRVVVVGAPDIARRLRGESAVEVIRTPNAFEALGEIGMPLEQSPESSVIVVAADEARRGGASLAEATRRLDPRARLVAIDADAPGFDAVAPADLTIDALHAAVRAADQRRGGLEQKNGGVARSGASHDATDAHPHSQSAGVDASPIEALLHGREPLESCLEHLRNRLHTPDLVFVRDPLTDHERAHGVADSPVERRGTRFGYLRSSRAAEADLRRAGAELAEWLALAEQHRQLRDAAFVDPLTGAWNRRYLDLFLARCIERARSGRHFVTVLLFDIDDFKTYNDRFGHGAGDEILIETVRLLRSVIRPTDRVCRLGGDEFVVVFDEPEGPRTPGSRHPESIRDIAERFQRQVREHRFPKLGERAPATLTISGGMATFPWDGHDPASLVEQADRLALESKRQGKNVVTYGPGIAREGSSGGSSEGSGGGSSGG